MEIEGFVLSERSAIVAICLESRLWWSCAI